MSREVLIRRGGPAALLGGALYFIAFGAAYLIYSVFAEHAKDTFFGQHAFIHMVDAPMFALLALGAVGIFLRQKDRLGKLGKAGFFLTFVGFGLSVVGGLTIVVVGLAVSDEATLGIPTSCTPSARSFSGSPPTGRASCRAAGRSSWRSARSGSSRRSWPASAVPCCP